MNLSLRQFSAITGLSDETVRKYIRRGLIAAVKVSGAYKISEEELQRYQSEGLFSGTGNTTTTE